MSELSEINAAVKLSGNFTPVVSYLKPNSFRFQIERAPNVTYTCQSIQLPSVTLGTAMQNTPFVDVPHPGDKVAFGELSIRYLVNEDMSNYLELYKWLTEVGGAYGGTDWQRAMNNKVSIFRDGDYNKAYSDAALVILDSNNNATTVFNFEDLFPVSVDGMDYDLTTSGMEYFVGSATFRFKLFKVKSLVNA